MKRPIELLGAAPAMPRSSPRRRADGGRFAALLGGNARCPRPPAFVPLVGGREERVPRGDDEELRRRAEVVPHAGAGQGRPSEVGSPELPVAAEGEPGARAEATARVAELLLKAAAVEELGGARALHLRLDGGVLGSLRVSLRMEGQRLHLEFDAPDAAAGRSLLRAMPQLSSRLQGRGWTVASPQVRIGARDRQRVALPQRRPGAGGSATTGSRRRRDGRRW